jgi:hypothetical protein
LSYPPLYYPNKTIRGIYNPFINPYPIHQFPPCVYVVVDFPKSSLADRDIIVFVRSMQAIRLEVGLALEEVELLLLVVFGEGGLVAGSLTLAGSGTVDTSVGSRCSAVCESGG